MSTQALERLRQLRRQTGQDAAAPASPPSAPPRSAEEALPALRRMLGLRARGQGAMPPLPSRRRDLPGTEIADGLRLIEQCVPWEAMPASVDGAFAREDAIAVSQLLFFDTETTGLAGGTGTRAFMIGASDFVDAGLRVRQLLISHLSAETAMLDTFAGWLSDDTRLVSYNGRCYDAPLLATRYRLARRRNPLEGRGHLDLLYPTRRRYRGVWDNCRLATIERRALAIVRDDDLPGSEAPAAWLGYLRGGSSDLLKRVAEHNFQDVVTLARLLGHLSEAGPCEPSPGRVSRRKIDAAPVPAAPLSQDM